MVEKASLAMSDNQETSIKINRAKIDSLEVFEVTSDELDHLCSGGPDSTLLNFSIATGSFGMSSFLSLISLDASSDRIYLTFFSITVISILACIVLLRLWWKYRGGRSKIIDRINDRSSIPSEFSSDETSNSPI